MERENLPIAGDIETAGGGQDGQIMAKGMLPHHGNFKPDPDRFPCSDFDI
jgi:hypothetical protein